MGLFFLLVIAIALVAVLPVWPYSRGWGYRPTWIIGALFIIILIIVLFRSVSYIEVEKDDGETTIKIEKKESK